MRGYTAQLRLWNDASNLSEVVYVFNAVLPTLGSVLLFTFAHGMLQDARLGVGEGLSLGTFLAFHVAFGTFLGGITSLSSTGGRLPRHLRQEQAGEADPRGGARDRPPQGRSGGAHRAHRARPRRVQLPGGRPEDPGRRQPHGRAGGVRGPGRTLGLREIHPPAAHPGVRDPRRGDGLPTTARTSRASTSWPCAASSGSSSRAGRLDAGSIFDNIACGSLITLDDAWAAAEDAGFAPEVREMPMGMHTMISVGGRQPLRRPAPAAAHRPRPGPAAAHPAFRRGPRAPWTTGPRRSCRRAWSGSR